MTDKIDDPILKAPLFENLRKLITVTNLLRLLMNLEMWDYRNLLTYLE